MKKLKSGKFLETNENENTTYQKKRDTAKAMTREKFITIDTYMKKKRYFKLTT